MPGRATLTAVLLLAAGPAWAEQIATDARTGCRIWDQYPDARKTIHWSGACRNGFAEGPGTLEWAYNGRPDGRARGTFVEGRLDGRAQVEWRDGRRMDGEFRQGRAEGQGSFVWPDGRRYSGDWKDDRRTGFGTLDYPDGRRFVGEFYRNRPVVDANPKAPQAAEAPRWSRKELDSFDDWSRER